MSTPDHAAGRHALGAVALGQHEVAERRRILAHFGANLAEPGEGPAIAIVELFVARVQRARRLADLVRFVRAVEKVRAVRKLELLEEVELRAHNSVPIGVQERELLSVIRARPVHRDAGDQIFEVGFDRRIKDGRMKDAVDAGADRHAK